VLTLPEIEAMQAAIAAAELEVRRLEELAAASSSFGGWLFPTDEQRTARAARATLEAIIGVRNGVIESGDHEEALRVVEYAYNVAKPGRVADAIARPPILENPLGTIWDWLKRTFRDLRWLVLGVVILLALAVVAYLLAQVRAFVPARSR
jgi:hypothetical protein